MRLLLVIVLTVLFGQPALAADQVKVRFGEHPGFDRLVFDWPAAVGVEMQDSADQVRLNFDRAGDMNLSRLRRDPPPGVRGVITESGLRGTSVVISVAPGSKLRLLKNGNAAILDILRPETPLNAPPARPDGSLGKPVPPSEIESTTAKTNAPGAAQAAKVASPEAKSEEATPPQPAPQAPNKDVVAAPLSPPADQRAPETANSPMATPGPVTAPPRKSATPLSLLKPPVPEPSAKGTAPNPVPPAPAPQAAPVAPVTPVPAPKAENSVAGKPKAATPKPAPQTGAKPESAAKPKILLPGQDGYVPEPKTDLQSQTQPPAGSPRLLILADQGPPQLNATSVGYVEGMPQTMNNLRFQWDTEVALAVFRTGPHIWLVFDEEASGNVTAGLEKLAPELAPIEQFRAPNATLIRVTAPPIMVPRVTRDGTSWVLELWPRPPRAEPAQRAEMEGVRDPSGVAFAMKGAGRAVLFHDPMTGTRMVVVPTKEQGQGLKPSQDYVQFDALESLQGLAFALNDEATVVAVLGNGVSVTHPNGLVLSHGSNLATLPTNVPAPSSGPRLFDLEAWRRGAEGDYFNVRQTLQSAMAAAPPERSGIARLELARFNFSHGFTSEAAGLMRLAESGDAKIQLDPEIRLMRGASAFLAGDYAGAAADLFHPSLNGEPEAELWNGAMAWLGFDWDVATKKFAERESLINAYPHPVRMRLRLMAIEAGLGAQDLKLADRYLDAARGDEPTGNEAAEIAVLLGYRHLKDGNTSAAMELWNGVVQDGGHRPSQVRARLALLDLAVARQAVKAEDAIAELERLRFAWRGDHIELALLRRLGDLYDSQGRYRDSLRAFREATVTMPTSRLARDVAARMREVFFNVMTDNAGQDLAPLSALALYEEFKELTPPGEDGDKVLSHLAERLVEIDLLPRAAELLSSLVKHRLTGERKAETGARVAEIHLLDEQPDSAITILGLSEASGLPDYLKRRRTYLRARALAHLSRYDEAMRLVASDNNPEALRLRADLLWEQANWPAASVLLAQLVPEQPRADRPLTESESRNVVDLAVALTLSEDRDRLAKLAKTYGQAMANGPDRETFALLTASTGRPADKSIAEKLAEVAKVEDFMASYRDRAQEASAN
jgi:tetratricopeptide (TPR) repeat protein